MPRPTIGVTVSMPNSVQPCGVQGVTHVSAAEDPVLRLDVDEGVHVGADMEAAA